MQCPRCQAENPSGMRFCGQCAAPLASVCAACGAANPPANRFCGQCAAPLNQAASPPKFTSPDTYTPKHLAERILTSKAALEGERKQVTVLFADGNREQGQEHLTTATTMYREMDMRFYLEQAETEMASDRTIVGQTDGS